MGRRHPFTTDQEKNMVNLIQIQKFLKGVDYPASKAALIENAKNMGADENVCTSLEQLPDEDFETPADVSQAFGKISDSGQKGGQQASQAEAGTSEFLAEALEDAMAEVELCQLALQQSANDEVKMFAQRMIDEHSKMGQEIEKLAGRKAADLPKDEKREHKKLMQEMSKLSGSEFDGRFIEYNVREHEKDIKVFQHYAGQESDKAVKAMAEQGVHMLEQHLKMAQDIRQRLKA
jgi:predicted outer membrane protein